MGLVRRFPLVSFVVLAFVITWSFQGAAILAAVPAGLPLGNESNLGHLLSLLAGRLSPEQATAYILFTLGAGPLISAIVVTAIADGRDGLSTLWRRSTMFRVGWRWYAIVIAIPLVLGAVSFAVGWVASGGFDYSPRVPFAMAVPFFVYMLVFTGVAEEPGWRGFALPRLQQRYSAEKASWILGPIWGIWHLPFIAYYNRGQGLLPLVGALVGLTVGIVGWTIVNTWVFNSTNSVWMMILLHGWGNTVQSYLVLSTNDPVAQTLYTLLPWALALVLLRRYGAEDLARHPRPRSTRTLD